MRELHRSTGVTRGPRPAPQSLSSAPVSTDPSFGALARRARGLLLLDGVTRVSPLRELVALLDFLERGLPAAGEAYGPLFRALLAGPPAADLLATQLMEAVLFDENALGDPGAQERQLSTTVHAAAQADLRTLQALAAVGLRLPAAIGRLTGETPPWPAGTEPASNVLAQRLASSTDWGTLAAELVEHYARHGGGLMARHRAFRWTGTDFVPVIEPDAPAPGSLVGYDEERALLRRNTEIFVAGYAANNVLLYGDRGTGKSSSVKSLLHREAAGAGGRPEDWERLRMIEVPKALLGDFGTIAAQLRARPQRFILFVDDLSFEEGETQYKDMKAVLEGGLEARPQNVVVYATSNRRHLIRELFVDRPAPDATEVHARDTVQEKLSLADRFGMTIVFPSPDQAAYLSIVEGLASQRGLAIDATALRARAVEWAAWHNGRSGRTARQLVDYLEGELGLAATGSR